MKIKYTAGPAVPCAVILGEFVFGPVRCGRLTTTVEDESGDKFPVCADHSTLDSGLKGIPRDMTSFNT